VSRREATADARAFARQTRDLYDGLLAEGFTEAQALHMLGVMVGTVLGTNTRGEEGG